MISRLPIQLVAFALVPCLIADPALGVSLSQEQFFTGPNDTAQSLLFNTEAFSMRAIWEALPFQSSGIRDARHLGAALELEQDTLFAGQTGNQLWRKVPPRAKEKLLSDARERKARDWMAPQDMGSYPKQRQAVILLHKAGLNEKGLQGVIGLIRQASISPTEENVLGKLLVFYRIKGQDAEPTPADWRKLRSRDAEAMEMVLDAAVASGSQIADIQQAVDLYDAVSKAIKKKGHYTLHWLSTMQPEKAKLVVQDAIQSMSSLGGTRRRRGRPARVREDLIDAGLSDTQSTKTLSKVFTDPEALALFQEEAAKVGFTKFETLTAQDPARTRELIGVKLKKGHETGNRWQVNQEELVVYRHFGETLSEIFKQEKRIDSQTPQTRAILGALLRIEKARVDHAGPLFDSLQTKIADRGELKHALATQSYLEISPKDATKNKILQDVAHFIWFAYVFRSPTYRDDHGSEAAFNGLIDVNVTEALEIDFRWLNPALASDITNRVSEIDKSLDPLKLRAPEEEMLFAGQSSDKSEILPGTKEVLAAITQLREVDVAQLTNQTGIGPAEVRAILEGAGWVMSRRYKEKPNIYYLPLEAMVARERNEVAYTEHDTLFAGQSSDGPAARYLPFGHISGVPSSGFALKGRNDSWNNVENWRNAILSPDGTQLAIAAVPEKSYLSPTNGVKYIVVYKRDKDTGRLMEARVSAIQYALSADGSAIMLAQGNDFYRIESAANGKSGFLRGSLKGVLLTALAIIFTGGLALIIKMHGGHLELSQAQRLAFVPVFLSGVPLAHPLGRRIEQVWDRLRSNAPNPLIVHLFGVAA